ncbi:MAG: hypothetical protein OEZ43_00210 [Gammaproteobacteria bacterium]|nr:hypothetical protein [Gammaproteobacteria bacterium]
MFWLITIALSAWTLNISGHISSGAWDAFILMCWITWPLLLCTLLITLKHRGQQTPFWRLQYFSDYLLTGALIPQIVGVILFNITLQENIENDSRSFSENLLFVGYYTVKLWLATALSVVVFYFAAKLRTKKPRIDKDIV